MSETNEAVHGEPGDDRAATTIAVVGGGPAGMTAALRLAERHPDASVLLLERQGRMGGKIVTERSDGFVLEGGPEALVVGKPAAAALLRDLGLADRMVSPVAATAGTAVRDGDRLRPLPDGLTGFLPRRFLPIVRSPLISLRGKLRMALEPFLPPRRDEADETVAAFFGRRIGREGYARLVAPLVESIWSGDGDELSLLAVFPQLRQAERQHGSLTRAALAANRAGGVVPAGPPLATLRGGLGELTEALTVRLGELGVQLRTDAVVEALDRAGDGWELCLAGGETVRVDGVVLAVPAPAAARLIAGVDPGMASALAAIPHASTATVALAYREADLPPLRGHGYVSRREPGVPATAATWVWRKWPERAPKGSALIRVSLGNLDRPILDGASDATLVDLARAELRRAAGIAAEPLLTRVVRWTDATPLAILGHRERVAAIEARRLLHPALALASAGLAGSGLADAIAAGDRSAALVAEALARSPFAADGSRRSAVPRLGLADVRRPNAPGASCAIASSATAAPT